MIVVLCQPVSKYIHTPLSVWCLKAAAEQAGSPHRVKIVDATIHVPAEETARLIAAEKPDAVGLSCYIWNIECVRRTVCRLREILPRSVPIVLGGPEVSFCADDVLRDNPGVDYVFRGEGEEAFPALTEVLAGTRSPRDVPGLVWRDGTRICSNPPACSRGEPPSPFTEAYFESQARHPRRLAYAETSRGCPFSCSFCLSGAGDSVRFFDLSESEARLKELARRGARVVKLVDRTFNCNPKRAFEIFEHLIESRRAGDLPPDTCFHFEVGADLFDEPTLRLLETAPKGLFRFEAGIQSFNEQTLAAVCRKTDLGKLESNLFRIIRRGNITVHADLIAGLPFENLDSFARSFDRAYRLRPHMLQLGFLKLIHGSALRAGAADLGIRFSPAPPYEVLNTPWMSESDLRRLKGLEEVLERLYNSGRFVHVIGFMLRRTGLNPFAFYDRLASRLFEKRDGLYRMPADGFAEEIFRLFVEMLPSEKGRIRDLMVLDRLACDNTRFMPDFLKVPDAALRRLKKSLNTAPGAKIGAAVIYRPVPFGVAANYDCPKDPVTGRYPLVKVRLPEPPATKNNGERT